MPPSSGHLDHEHAIAERTLLNELTVPELESSRALRDHLIATDDPLMTSLIRCSSSRVLGPSSSLRLPRSLRCVE